MAIDRWFIGGGAEHTPESARRLTYTATAGSEGVGSASDLKVVPLEVPGTGVRVLTGTSLVRSRYVGGEQQSYMGAVTSQEVVSIASTGSAAGRTDLVVLRIEDPFAAGSPWSVPSDVTLAPYAHIRVISGVGDSVTRVQDVPGHENDTAITLARVTLPASTGTVTAALITDLRSVAQPRRSEGDARLAPSTNAALTSTTAVNWPPVNTQVYIPEWATEAFLDGYIYGVETITNAVDGYLFLRLEGTTTVDSTRTYYNHQYVSTGERTGIPVGGKVAIPEALRGKTVTLKPMGQKGNGLGHLRVNAFDGQVRLTWNFKEAAI